MASNATGKTLVKRSNALTTPLIGRRKLGGQLEVSSIGLGVQNMSRTYETTIPSRPEMIRIIRAAFDNGVTLFDTAEAYGPFECERILGEGTPIIQRRWPRSLKRMLGAHWWDWN